MSDVVDLRSDTVTRPSPAMRRAMAEAEVGDDVYGEDPTVARLEERAAALVGHPAALFVPTGTMGNQIALHLHGRPGDLVLCDRDSHVVHYEMSAMAVWSGLQPQTVTGERGLLDAETVRAGATPGSTVESGTRVLVLENSHNLAGGVVYPPAQLAAAVAAGRAAGLRVHLDGARIFNAACAVDRAVEELTASFDSVMFCLSKGLGAPVGSMLCGPSDWIAEARIVRKRFGGGMRQVGVLAAAGLVALEEGPPLLPEDHRHAALLAAGLEEIPGVGLLGGSVETNIVVWRLDEGRVDAQTLVDELGREGVRIGRLRGGRMRMVTHRDVDERGVLRALEVVRRVLTR